MYNYSRWPRRYWVVTPQRAELSNLLVTATPSGSHIGFSSLRMEPTFMVLGHSAGTAAAIFAANRATSTLYIDLWLFISLLALQSDLSLSLSLSLAFCHSLMFQPLYLISVLLHSCRVMMHSTRRNSPQSDSRRGPPRPHRRTTPRGAGPAAAELTITSGGWWGAAGLGVRVWVTTAVCWHWALRSR